MRLPFLGSFGKKEVKNYYLALLLQDEKIGAVILEESGGKIHVATRAEEQFRTSLEKAPFEEWLDTIDKAVSLAETSEGLDIQTEKTVFGVKQDWIEDGKIKKEYLLKLKKVCEELALEPIGFLVFTEAIIHLLQQEEGAPVSAILIETGKKFLTLSLVRAGRIIQTHVVANEEPIPEAVDSALKHLEVEILPARIILYTNENDQRLVQQFISHTWSKSLPFLHMPQITVLPTDFDTKGVLYGTATQLGLTVIDEHSIPSRTYSKGKEVSKEESKGPKETKESKGEIDEEEIASNENAQEPKEKEIEKTEQEVSDEDIAASFKKEPEPSDTEDKENKDDETLEEEIELEGEKDKEKSEIVNSEYFGFVENKDVNNVSHKDLPKYQKSQELHKATENVFEEIPEDVKEEETGEKNHTADIGSQGALIMAGMQKVMRSVVQSLPLVSKPLSKLFAGVSKQKPTTGTPSSSLPIKPIIAVAVILLVLLGIVLFYMFGTQATVAITLSPKITNQSSPITFAIDGQSDFSSNQIGAKSIDQNESGSLSQDTTGTKQTGTQAKGIITIFSRLANTTTINKGTIVISSNNLQFTLDDDVNIASFSGDTSDPSVTVANVAITAKDIGPDYNLPSGTKFSIDGLDKGDISGKNDDPFSGGTTKDVRIVSKDDVDKIIGAITKNLEPNAQNDIKKQLSDNQQLLSFFAKEDVTKKDLSKNIGDESKTVSVDVTITYSGIVVDKQDLNSFATNVIKEKVASEANFANSKIETNLSDINQNNNTITANLQIKATLLPQMDTGELVKTISGKSFSEAQDTIKQQSQVSDVAITLSPNFPFLPHILPRIPSHVHIRFVTNE